jgi:hypothetical protein
MRIEEERASKKALNGDAEEKRLVVRPRGRW